LYKKYKTATPTKMDIIMYCQRRLLIIYPIQ